MSIFPTSPLVRHVQGLIVDTFEVSPDQAHDIAAELVSLAGGWGSPEASAQLDWSYRIKKDLGETKKLTWRSEEERARFEAEEWMWDTHFGSTAVPGLAAKPIVDLLVEVRSLRAGRTEIAAVLQRRATTTSGGRALVTTCRLGTPSSSGRVSKGIARRITNTPTLRWLPKTPSLRRP